MKASVIIPNLNGAGWLRDSIESVWAQTEQDFELIVIDNGSTDESLDIARSYCGRDRYTLIENAGNTGFSHAVNQGIAIAKGEYMALFNNDAFAEPDWLAELIKTADADPKIFAVSSLMLRYYEPELADDAGDYVTILGFACKRGDGLKASRYTKPCRVFSACGGAALYRKSILDEIGVFDELFFAYYEDVDLSWRANNFGYRNVYCPTARCRHICGATTGGCTMPTALMVAKSSASDCGLDLLRRVLSGFSTSERGSISLISMGMLLLEPALRRPFPVFLPKTPPDPRSGRAGAIAGEHPCPAGQAGLTALRKTTGRDRAGGD